MSTATADTYAQTLDFLFSRLPMFSRIGAAAIKKDLDNTLELCAGLGNPETKFKSVHIAGTNGKGSTSHMLAAVFQAAGYKTGLYTSPHLVDFRERIRIDGAPIDETFVIDFVAANQSLIESIQPSFFELTVAMAFDAFAKAEVDIAIIETGLGGRLDSTNVIDPELSVITNISLDHTDLLGTDISSIAGEKAGIIKIETPVVIGEFNSESWPVFEKKAADMRSELFAAWESRSVRAEADDYVMMRKDGQQRYVSDLRGSFQEKNIATVLTAIDVLRERGWNLPEAAVAGGLANVRKLTGLRGRWDIWQEAPLMIADVGHNPGGLEITLRDWDAVRAAAKHILVGFVRDKDVAGALARFPKDATYHFCAARIPRALPADELSQIGATVGLRGTGYSSVAEALSAVMNELGQEDALLITGSFFVVGEAMQSYEQELAKRQRIHRDAGE
jgi:dihydrofolate synthase/folylpolyglutamate synthase